MLAKMVRISLCLAVLYIPASSVIADGGASVAGAVLAAEAVKMYHHFTGNSTQTAPANILNLNCSVDNFQAPRGPFNKWYNTKICCTDLGCIQETDKNSYPTIKAENTMRERIRQKVAETAQAEIAKQAAEQAKVQKAEEEAKAQAAEKQAEAEKAAAQKAEEEAKAQAAEKQAEAEKAAAQKAEEETKAQADKKAKEDDANQLERERLALERQKLELEQQYRQQQLDMERRRDKDLMKVEAVKALGELMRGMQGNRPPKPSYPSAPNDNNAGY